MKWIRQLLQKLIDRYTKPQPEAPAARYVPLADIAAKSITEARLPSVTWMRFTFADGHALEFKQYNTADYWGGVPAVGFGKITRPDGTSANIDINTRIRKGARAYPYPANVPDLGWGNAVRYHIDGKTLYRRADGLPLECAVAVDLNKSAIGISAALTAAEARVEAWQ